MCIAVHGWDYSVGDGEIAQEGTTNGRNQTLTRSVFPLPLPTPLQARYILIFRPFHHPTATEIYQTAPEYRRECSYYIALGYYKLGNYGMARKFNGTPVLPLSTSLALSVVLSLLWWSVLLIPFFLVNPDVQICCSTWNLVTVKLRA